MKRPLTMTVAALLAVCASNAFSQGMMGGHEHMMQSGSKTKTEMLDMHQKMADMHKKMSECLKSDKSTEDCHAEMKKECRGMMKDCPMMSPQYCPMMGSMMKSESDGS